MVKRSKLLSVLLSGAMLTSVLVGCGSSNETSDGSDNSSSDGKDTLVVWSHFQQNEVDALQDVVKQWGEENNVKVDLKYDGSEFDAMSQALQSGKGPDVVLGYPHDNLGKLYKAGLLATCPDDLIDESLYSSENLFDSVTVNGDRIGVPVCQESIALYYNKDLVSSVPETFEELIKIGKEKGFEFDLTNFYYAAGFLLNGDSYIFKNNNGTLDVNDIGLDSSDAIKGLEFLKELVDEGLMASDITDDIAKSDFQAGKTAFYISGPWNVDSTKDANVNFDIAELPTLNGNKLSNLTTIQSAFVPSKSKNQDLAWELIKYLSENASQVLFEEGSRLPVLTSAMESDWFKSADYVQGFLDQAENGTPTPNIAEMSTVWNPCANNIKSVLNGELTAEEARSYMEDGQFEAGSMLPKIEASVEFVSADKDRRAIITDLSLAKEALAGKAGTLIHK